MKSVTQYKKKPPYLLFIISSILTVLILSIVLIWFVLIGEYRRWVSSFEANIKQDNIVTLDMMELREGVEKKIEAYSKSSKKTDYIEIKDSEFVYLLAQSLDNSLPLNIKFHRGYVKSGDGLWNIYIQTKYSNTTLPWVEFKLSKDNTQSAQIYIQSVSIGNFNLTDYGARNIVRDINNGINESIMLINQSNFTGRIFRNIELESGVMTIKGDK